MNTFCPKCFESHEIKDFIKLNAEKQNSKKPELMKQIKEIKDTLERI